jgi:hypothetical protein
MRRIYNEGLAKLTSDSFESEEAKAEWQRWVEDLTPRDLRIVSDSSWQ